MSRRVLILGGTHEAREVASHLVRSGHDVTTSLAGVTTSPVLPEGKLRVGGFGGVDGLVDYLQSQCIDVLVDATHPFAAIMSAHASVAAERAQCRLLRLEREAWHPQEGDDWTNVASIAEAAALLPAHAVVLVTSGRRDLGAFFSRPDVSGIVRTVEPIVDAVPPQWRVILDRPPQTPESEIALMGANRITHLVTKNAGGDRTRAKLDAARVLGLPVIMVRRPAKPFCETFSSGDQILMQLGT